VSKGVHIEPNTTISQNFQVLEKKQKALVLRTMPYLPQNEISTNINLLSDDRSVIQKTKYSLNVSHLLQNNYCPRPKQLPEYLVFKA
jgi:hypothetical protein